MRYELHDERGQVLGRTESHGDGKRMLHALVLTSPGMEEELSLVRVTSEGDVVSREDIWDVLD